MKITFKIFRQSIMIKIIIFILMVIILPFTMMMFFLLRSLSDTSTSVEQKALSQTTLLVEQDLLSNIAAKGQIIDLTFKNLIIDLDKLKEDITERGYSEKILADYYYKNQITANVFFVDAKNSIYITPEVEGIKPGDVFDQISYQEVNLIMSTEGQKTYTGVWLSPHNSFNGQTKVITYLLPVWKTDKMIGVVGFDIPTDSIFSEIVHVDPTQSSYVFISKGDGTVFYSSDKIFNDFQIANYDSVNILNSPVFKKEGVENIFSSYGKKEGTFRINMGSAKDEKIVAFSSISSLGGKFFVVTPLNEIVQVQKEKAQDLQKAVNQVATNGAFYTVAFSIFIVIFSFFLSRQSIVNPLEILQQGIKNFEKTGSNTRVKVKTQDEIGKLAESFNNMADGLKDSRSKLEEYSKNLEKQVTERTKELEYSKDELESKVEDLEKFNKVAVDRELKMIELKTKIKELEERQKAETPKKSKTPPFVPSTGLRRGK